MKIWMVLEMAADLSYIKQIAGQYNNERAAQEMLEIMSSTGEKYIITQSYIQSSCNR